METNKILSDEEVIETTVEIVSASPDRAFKMAAGVGLAVLTGVITYMYVVKPTLAKIKAKKDQRKSEEAASDPFEDAKRKIEKLK